MNRLYCNESSLHRKLAVVHELNFSASNSIQQLNIELNNWKRNNPLPVIQLKNVTFPKVSGRSLSILVIFLMKEIKNDY